MRVCSPAEVRLLVYVSPCWWRVVTDVLLRWTEGDQMKWRLDLLVEGISALPFLRWTRTDGHFSHVETVTSKGGVSYLLTTAFVSQCPSSCRRARCASSRCRSASPTSTWRPSLPGCCAPATRREPSTPAWYSSVFNLKGSEQSRGSQVLVSQGYGLKIIPKGVFSLSVCSCRCCGLRATAADRWCARRRTAGAGHCSAWRPGAACASAKCWDPESTAMWRTSPPGSGSRSTSTPTWATDGLPAGSDVSEHTSSLPPPAFGPQCRMLTATQMLTSQLADGRSGSTFDSEQMLACYSETPSNLQPSS